MSTRPDNSFIRPEWPLPGNVQALVTTRLGGVSHHPFNSFNLGAHVNDNASHVSKNRSKLAAECGLPDKSLQWLNQTHGTFVCEAKSDTIIREADASYSTSQGVACVIMTADCLPVLLCDKQGRQVAAIHAGWRSLAGGIIEATLATFSNPLEVTAWLGPAIGSTAFEVGKNVVDAFCTKLPEPAINAFSPHPNKPGKWLADLYLLARIRLQSLGVKGIYGGDFCTFNDELRFYSYRRDGQTGRMASLIWLT